MSRLLDDELLKLVMERGIGFRLTEDDFAEPMMEVAEGLPQLPTCVRIKVNLSWIVENDITSRRTLSVRRTIFALLSALDGAREKARGKVRSPKKFRHADSEELTDEEKMMLRFGRMPTITEELLLAQYVPNPLLLSNSWPAYMLAQFGFRTGVGTFDVGVFGPLVLPCGVNEALSLVVDLRGVVVQTDARNVIETLSDVLTQELLSLAGADSNGLYARLKSLVEK